MTHRNLTSVKAIAFDFVGVLAHPRMAFDGPEPYVFVIDEVVAALVDEARRNYKTVALISNNDRQAMLSSALGPRISQMFDALVFASDVANPKPHPEMFHRLLNQLELPAEQCALIDDSYRNCDVAEALGFITHVATDSAGIKEFVDSLY